MTILAFDTLKLARKLEAGGFSAQQAESVAEAFADVVQDAPSADQWAELRAEMATKKDLQALETALRADMATKKDLQALEAALRADMATKKDLEQFATKKDLEQFATKKDLEQFATKKDIENLSTNVAILRSHVTAELASGKYDILKWVFMAVAAQGALVVAVLKLLP